MYKSVDGLLAEHQPRTEGLFLLLEQQLCPSRSAPAPNREKTFDKHFMEGQINSAMRFLNDDACGGVLPLTDDVMLQLRQKHPEAQEAKIETLLHGPVHEIPESLYLEINGSDK